MRKISRHHAHHPDSGVPMCEIDMVTDSNERVVLHQEGIASHPLAGKYTGDQIQIIEFINGLLFNRQEENMNEAEIEYLLYNHEAIKRRVKEEEKPKAPEPSAQPSIFGKAAPLITDKPKQNNATVFVTTPVKSTPTQGVSLDGSFYRQPEEVVTPEPVQDQVFSQMDSVIAGADLVESIPDDMMEDAQNTTEEIISDVTFTEEVISDISFVNVASTPAVEPEVKPATKTKRKRKTPV